MLNKKRQKNVYVRQLVTPESFHIKVFKAMDIPITSFKKRIKIA